MRLDQPHVLHFVELDIRLDEIWGCFSFKALPVECLRPQMGKCVCVCVPTWLLEPVALYLQKLGLRREGKQLAPTEPNKGALAYLLMLWSFADVRTCNVSSIVGVGAM